GDTGGGKETLGAMLNTSIVGHSWATNDMEAASMEGLHFGYLQPWSQINSWNYFRMPWIQGAKLADAHKFYASLRSRLVPYLYSWGRHASITGWPLMAPLTLDFPKDPECAENLHQYLLGRDLMVGAFQNEIYFPEGRWRDFWRTTVVEGSCRRTVDWPNDRGGALYLREGAIIPLGPVMQYRGEKPMDEMELLLFPGREKSVLEFYEDDGVSFKAFENNEFAVTKITMNALIDGNFDLTIAEPDGDYDDRPESRTWKIVALLDSKPVSISLNGVQLSDGRLEWFEKRKELVVNCVRSNFCN
ncbi:MAG: DUF5110 domain-containing protein, partial [Victivallales bacterium]|nr:DUF5110 domain-containing protein [Victivallales bacterium]